MNNDADAIRAAYYERLGVLFRIYAEDPTPVSLARFCTGINQARTARDRAIDAVKEVTT